MFIQLLVCTVIVCKCPATKNTQKEAGVGPYLKKINPNSHRQQKRQHHHHHQQRKAAKQGSKRENLNVECCQASLEIHTIIKMRPEPKTFLLLWIWVRKNIQNKSKFLLSNKMKDLKGLNETWAAATAAATAATAAAAAATSAVMNGQGRE